MRTPVRHVGVRLFLSLAAGATAMLGLVGCASDEPTTRETAAGAELGRLDPEQFAARMGNPDAAVINVHVPYEGELESTDAFIHFERIVGDAQLPEDKDSEVLLYCMTGRMSDIAGKALIGQAGYTDVAHLEGGMKAWEAAGRRLIHDQNHAQ